MPVEVTERYIRIRVENPKNFVRFRIKTLGKGIRAIIGFPKKGGSRIQSFLFDRKKWTLKQAKAWVKRHGYSIAETFAVRDIIFDKQGNFYFDERPIIEETKKPKVDIWDKLEALFGE